MWSRPSGLSEVGENVKLHELQYETKWSVLAGKGWGEQYVLLKFAIFPNVSICKYLFKIM